MEGRLFSGSTSIYQDEAKVLFNFFSEAADKIIGEEKLSESKLESYRSSAKSLRKKKLVGPIIVLLLAFGLFISNYKLQFMEFMTSAYISGGLLVIAFIIFLVYSSQLGKMKKMINAEEDVYKKIRREYNVGKMGVAYVPVAKRLPFEDKTVTIDMSGSVPDENFNLMTLDDPDGLKEGIDKLRDQVTSVPIIDRSTDSVVDTSDMSISIQQIPMSDYSGKLQESATMISDALGKVRQTSVSLPVINPESDNMQFLKDYGTMNPEEYPVLDVFNLDELQPQIDVFHEMYRQYEMEKGSGDTEAMQDLLLFLGESNQIISRNKLGSVTSILEYNNDIFANVLKSSSINISPRLESEMIEQLKQMSFNFSDMADDYKPFTFKESSVMKFDLFSNSWIDNMNNHSSMPFSLNQIQQEIFMPMIASLMEENRIERQKIYDEVQKEKMKYLNEWQKETQDFYGRNRDTADTLKSNIVQTLSKYNAAYASWKSLKETLDKLDAQQGRAPVEVTQSEEASSSEVLLSSNEINTQFEEQQNEFDGYMERLLDDIEDKASQFGFINYYEASLYADEAKKVAIAADEVGKLDARALRIAKVNPYYAKYGSLPPRPSIEEGALDLINSNLYEESKKMVMESRAQSMEAEESAETDEVDETPELEDLPEDFMKDSPDEGEPEA